VNIEYLTLKVLWFIYEAKGFGDFKFTKAEFIKAYYTLVKQGKIPKLKIESILRKLRDLASRGNVVRYADYRGGVYYCDSAMLSACLKQFEACYKRYSQKQ